MSKTLRVKIINWLGVIGILIQILRYSFDRMDNLVLEGCVFSAFLLMAVNLTELKKLISNKFRKNAE